jgi:proteic killer suppression protein
MDLEFADSELERMAREADATGGFSQAIVRAFRLRVQFIKAAVDERDLYQMRSLRFEKLKGARSHQRSIRLNNQWRLILEIIPGNPKNTIRIVGIEDYH